MDAVYNEKGQEMPDNTPVELPLGARNPESLSQMITRLVRIHSELAVKEHLESFEEAEDFETGEGEPLSPFQMTDMQEEVLANPPAPTPAPAEPAAALKS